LAKTKLRPSRAAEFKFDAFGKLAFDAQENASKSFPERDCFFSVTSVSHNGASVSRGLAPRVFSRFRNPLRIAVKIRYSATSSTKRRREPGR
jgi:hypothetical protein